MTSKVFGKDFFKLQAILLWLEVYWTDWTISHVYEDLQCYENQKHSLKEKYASKRHASKTKTNSYVSYCMRLYPQTYFGLPDWES